MKEGQEVSRCWSLLLGPATMSLDSGSYIEPVGRVFLGPSSAFYRRPSARAASCPAFCHTSITNHDSQACIAEESQRQNSCVRFVMPWSSLIHWSHSMNHDVMSISLHRKCCKSPHPDTIIGKVRLCRRQLFPLESFGFQASTPYVRWFC